MDAAARRPVLDRPAGRHAGFALDIAASTTDYFIAQSLVAAGVGISLIPEVGLSPSPALVSCPVAAPRPVRRFGVVTAGRRPRRPHIDAPVEVISCQAGLVKHGE